MLLFPFSGMSQAITKITGFAPNYVGQAVELFEIEDYFSMREQLIATTMVKEDSTFNFQFFNDKTQKVIVKANKNTGFLYIQPKGNYEVYLPSSNRYDAYRPMGNEVEIAFFNLDSTDINYQILAFDKWMNSFLGTYFPSKKINGSEFVLQLERFKENAEKYYEKDSSLFLKTHVRFSIAALDDIQFAGARNRYEKFDFYIDNYPVSYSSDSYMSYINSFYSNLIPRLSKETNDKVYLGILKSSPTIIINALAKEYTLRPSLVKTSQGNKMIGNARLRELVMIKGLSNVYYSADYPKTNILKILDSLSNHSIFAENKVIAKNLIYRLTELVPGAKSADFLLTTADNKVRTLSNYAGKHLYIHFFSADNKESIKELDLLKSIYERYKGEVNFISVFEKEETTTKKNREIIKSMPWEVFELDKDDQFYKTFKPSSYPFYVLLDQAGYLVGIPALSPKPNGQYLSIDKVFFDIKKMNEKDAR
jgi:hypothetical protein